MQGIVGALILAAFLAFIEIRSRRNGHAQRREDLRDQINLARDLRDQSVARHRDAQELTAMVQRRYDA